VVSATRYAPVSSIRISGAVADAGGSVQLWLEDGGPGISAADLPRILDNLYCGR
jgi:signal transduction histidine kinase